MSEHAKKLFNDAKRKADKLPSLIATYELESAIMKPHIAEWVYQVEWVIDNPSGVKIIEGEISEKDISPSIIRTATKAIDLIIEHLNKKYN